MTAIPCRESSTPDDWFINLSGKQYSDDQLLTPEEIDAARSSIWDKMDPDAPAAQFIEAGDEAVAKATEEAKRLALIRRRHAKEDCYTCPIRLKCLHEALTHKHEHGTWGGYYEEELRTIRRHITNPA